MPHWVRLLRWQLSVWLNASFPSIPPGTAVEPDRRLRGRHRDRRVRDVDVAAQWRLFVITGFCGGLTTFSTFSAELVILLQQGRSMWALAAAGVHLVGSVAMTFAGIGTVFWPVN